MIRPGFDRFLPGPVGFDQEGDVMLVTKLVQPPQQTFMHRFCPVTIHLAGDKQDTPQTFFKFLQRRRRIGHDMLIGEIDLPGSQMRCGCHDNEK